MDSKYLIIGVFVILLLVTALQAYQLNTINARLNNIQLGAVLAASGSGASGDVVQTTQTAAPQSTGLPTQVGGC